MAENVSWNERVRKSAVLPVALVMILVVTLPGIVSAVCTGTTNIVADGGFEDESVYFQSTCPCSLIPPWVMAQSGKGGTTAQGGWGTEGLYAAVVSLDDSATGDWISISQEVSGGQYCTLSFTYSTWLSGGRESDLFVYLDDTVVWSAHESIQARQPEKKSISIDVSSFSGTHTLKFLNRATIGGEAHGDWFVDDVKLMTGGTTPPPPPPLPTGNLLDPCPGPGTMWEVIIEGYPMYWDFRPVSSPVGEESCTMVYHAGNYNPNSFLRYTSFHYLRWPDIQMEAGYRYKFSFWYRGKSLDGPHGQQGGSDTMGGVLLFKDPSMDPMAWRYYEREFYSPTPSTAKLWIRTFWVTHGWNEQIGYPMWLEVTSLRLVDSGGPSPPPTPVPTEPRLLLTGVSVLPSKPEFGQKYTLTLNILNDEDVATTRTIKSHEFASSPGTNDRLLLQPLPGGLPLFVSGGSTVPYEFPYNHDSDPFDCIEDEVKNEGILQEVRRLIETGLSCGFDILKDVGKDVEPFNTVFNLWEIQQAVVGVYEHRGCKTDATYEYTFTGENVVTGPNQYPEMKDISELAPIIVKVCVPWWKWGAYEEGLFNITMGGVYAAMGLISTVLAPLGGGTPLAVSLAFDVISATHEHIAVYNFQTALDPVPDYTEPVVTEAYNLPELDELPPEYGSMAEYGRQLELTVEHTQGATDATIKYNGALEAGDAPWAEILQKERYKYHSLLSDDYLSLRVKAVPMLTDVQDLGLNPTEEDVRAAKQQIRQEGLPEGQADALRRAGFTDKDIEAIRDITLMIPDDLVANYFQTIPSLLEKSEYVNSLILGNITADLGADAPPGAAFSSTLASGLPPLSVKFTDASVRGPTTWTWTFGDGGASDQPSPSHTYTPPGTYTVALTVSNDDGSDTRTRYDLVHVLVPAKVKVLPRTLNLASKGAFVAFARLPDGYDTSGVLKDSVTCGGAPAEKLIRSSKFPRVFGAVFRRDKLQEVSVGDKVSLTLSGKLSQGGETYEFTGTDTVRVINRGQRNQDELEDVSGVKDEKLFERYAKEIP